MQEYVWHNETFVVSPERLLYWPEQNAIIVSDLHLGKTGHFRKYGIAVPENIFKADLHRLFSAIQFFKPKKIIIVGDMVHSVANNELDVFSRWRQDLPQTEFILIQGNHDILAKHWYKKNDIAVSSSLLINDVLFVHNSLDAEQLDLPYKRTISGHLHPSILLKMGARQHLNLPCFYFTDQSCILPAFSLFSGTCAIRQKKSDVVFAIIPGKNQIDHAPALLKL